MRKEEIYEMLRREAGGLMTEAEALLFPADAGEMSEEDFRERLRKAREKGDAYRRKAYELLDAKTEAAAEEEAALLQQVRRHVHTDTGRVLIASGYYLEKEFRGEKAKERKEIVLREWREVIDALQNGVFNEAHIDVRSQLKAAANASGVKVIFQSEIPSEAEDVRRYTKEAVAKIMAAVRAKEDSVVL